jgi:mycofactocin system glycosyltransferase
VNEPLPIGFGIVSDPDTRQLDGTTLFGGSPQRVMRLSPAGAVAWDELQRGVVRTSAGAVLARRLVDAGLAHPRPPAPVDDADVTVLIPVRDRSELLDRCLTALGTRHPVLVVDDGSAEPRSVADVAAVHGATLIRRAESGGPAAARNTGLAHIASDVVAFLDSDCVPSPEWIDRLAAHFADSLVGAVAPRVLAVASSSAAGRYGAANGSLDAGDREARVVPTTRVAYVPTAALLVRRTALLKAAQDGDVFDPALRYGEDVDLIWRLHEAGWRVRYDPSVSVGHREPQTWIPLLARRFHYGTSAAPLAGRHPDAIAPLVLQPLPTLTVAAVLARRPFVAGIGFAASVASMRRNLRRAGVPAVGVPQSMATAVRQTGLGVGRYGTQFAAPLLAAALAAGGRRRWGRRAAITSLLLAPPLTRWLERRPALDPVRFTLGHLADDIAYGAGVCAGAARSRTSAPLRPRIAWRTVRITRTANPKGSS